LSKAIRRQARRSDPLASIAAIGAKILSLRTSLPHLILRRLRSCPRCSRPCVSSMCAAPPKRGAAVPRYNREQFLRVDGPLRGLLGRETRTFVRNCVGQYMPLLDFPGDVREALERGDLNLFEVHQLADLSVRKYVQTHAETLLL
jgi:hypothetical protein